MEDIIKVLNYQPAQVNDSDIEDPVSRICYFFVNHQLHESRTKLWELYKGWIHLAAESPDGEELTDMLFFYNQMIELLNFCYILKEKTSKGS